MLHRTAYLGIGNDFVANCVRQYPDRLQGLAFIEPWLVQPKPRVQPVRPSIQASTPFH